MKKCVLMISAFLQILIKIGPLTKVLYRFWHKSGLICPWMTFEVILQVMKNLGLNDVIVDILENFLKD